MKANILHQDIRPFEDGKVVETLFTWKEGGKNLLGYIKKFYEAKEKIPSVFIQSDLQDVYIVSPKELLEVIKKEVKYLTGPQIQKLLKVSRGYFWQIKKQKGFPDPVYRQGRVELWRKKDIEEYAENKKIY
jgi:predicted DNA-binding transcriptional regulator AlpA